MRATPCRDRGASRRSPRRQWRLSRSITRYCRTRFDVDDAMRPDAPLLFEDMITRGVVPAPTAIQNISSGSNSRSAISTPASPEADEVIGEGVKTRWGGAVHQKAISSPARHGRPCRCRRSDRDLGVAAKAISSCGLDAQLPQDAGRRYPRDPARSRRVGGQDVVYLEPSRPAVEESGGRSRS